MFSAGYVWQSTLLEKARKSENTGNLMLKMCDLLFFLDFNPIQILQYTLNELSAPKHCAVFDHIMVEVFLKICLTPLEHMILSFQQNKRS